MLRDPEQRFVAELTSTAEEEWAELPPGQNKTAFRLLFIGADVVRLKRLLPTLDLEIIQDAREGGWSWMRLGGSAALFRVLTPKERLELDRRADILVSRICRLSSRVTHWRGARILPNAEVDLVMLVLENGPTSQLIAEVLKGEVDPLDLFAERDDVEELPPLESGLYQLRIGDKLLQYERLTDDDHRHPGDILVHRILVYEA